VLALAGQELPAIVLLSFFNVFNKSFNSFFEDRILFLKLSQTLASKIPKSISS